MVGLTRGTSRSMTRDNVASDNALIRNLGGGGGGDASFPALGGYTYSHTMTDTTGANGLDPILDLVSPTSRFTNGGVFFSDDGLHVVAASDLPGEIATFELSTAFDLSTASQVGTNWDLEFTNPWQVGFSPTGEHIIRSHSGDELTIFHLTTAWQISDSPTDTEHSACTKAQMGHDSGSQDGSFWISKDGLYVYALVTTVAHGSTLSVMPLNTAWDLSDQGTVRLGDAGAVPFTAPFQGGIKFSDDGLTCWAWEGNANNMHQMVLNTAWDPSDGVIAVTSDTSSYPSNNSNSDQDIMYVSWDMSRLYFNARINGSIEVWTQ